MKIYIVNNKQAFTLVEIMISLVLMGVMASLAIPRVHLSIERMRVQEAKQLIIEIMKAQNNYRLENGVYTNDINDLDISIPSSKNFNNPVLFAVANPGDVVAQITSKSTEYELHAEGTGIIFCEDWGAGLGMCKKLGF